MLLRRFWKEEPSILDEPITNVLNEMNVFGPDSQEYPQLLGHLERLVEMKSKNRRQSVSSDTLVLVAGNLLGILIIVAYEQKHVMVSKGLGFVLKPKS